MSDFLRLTNGFARQAPSDNLISGGNSTFENNSVNDWTRYQDAAQFEPIDGTGGSPSSNLTYTATASAPLRGTYSALLTKSGSANMQGYGVSLSSIAVPLEFRGQECKLSLYYAIASGTYTSADQIIRLYDMTNGALIASNVEAILSTVTGVASRFECRFTPSTTCANVRVIIHTASPTTNNYTISFDDFSLWATGSAPSTSFASTSWSGYHDTSYNNWYFNNTGAYADPSSNDSNGNEVVELDNNGFGSVVSNFTGARKLPGLIFTPPKLGRFKITASITVANTGGSYIAFQLVDGSTIIGEGSHNGSTVSGGITLEGLFNATALTSRTITIRARVQSSSGTITNFGFQQSMITWNIESLNSVDGIGSGQSASAIYHYDTWAGWGSTNNKIPYWTNLDQASDSSSLLTISNSSSLGFSVTANRRALVSMVWNITTNAGDYAGISKNSNQLTTAIDSIARVNQVTYQYNNAANYSITISVSVMLEPGDVLRPHAGGTTTNSNSLNNIFVQGVEIQAPVGGTLSALGTALYNFGPNASGLSSTNTAIPYYSALNNSTDPSGLLDVVNSSTFGLSVTAKRSCLVSMTYPMSYNTADYKGISLNSTSLSSSIDSQTQAVTVAKTFSAANTITLVTVTVPMVAGDILRPHLATGVTINSYMLFVSAVETNVVVYGGTSNSSQTIENLGLTPSVGGSALTIAMKNATGSDPTSSSPVSLGMRSPTLNLGTFNIRKVMSANSIVIPSGATLGLESGSDGYIFVYALDNGGTIEMAVSSIWRDDSLLGTTTTISSASDDNGFYSATGRTSVPFRLIGRFRYSTNPNGTYSAIPDECSLISSDLFPSVCLSNTGSYHTAIGNGHYQASNGNSLTLQPGFYRVDGTSDVEPIANSLTHVFDRTTYWSLANGNDTNSAPALVTSSAKLVFNNYDPNNYDCPEWNSQNGNYNFWNTTVKPMFVEVKKTCTIYLVQYLASDNVTNQQSKLWVQAIQVRKVP